MSDLENKDLNPQPAEASEPSAQPQGAPSAQEPAPEAEGRPVPQLTLEPDPPAPAIHFPDPPRAPEPPTPQAEPAPQGQYSYSGSQVHQDPPYQQPPQQEQSYQQSYGQSYQANYQPPNYTAQSYQPVQPQQPKYTTPPVGYQQKSRLAAGLLAIMLGVFGVHNFYMGFNSRGTIQLVLSLAGGLLTCGLGTVAAAVWGLIEGVMLLSSNGPRFDGNGVIMRD
ncbi:NINE protein [Oscillospiraceae bacterium 42-9]